MLTPPDLVDLLPLAAVPLAEELLDLPLEGLAGGSSESESSSSSGSSIGFGASGFLGWFLKCWLNRSLLFRFSCGPTVSPLNRVSTWLMSPEEYWKSLLLLLKMMSAIWQSQRTESSIAFFMRPFLRFVNVTCACAGGGRESSVSVGSSRVGGAGGGRGARSGRDSDRSPPARSFVLETTTEVKEGRFVTCRLRSSAMRSMRIFLRPTAYPGRGVR